ncbi:LysR family transcriptional regulator [Cytobacillus gottheilii]|uniref:LysR family transcriptional regulator n=1 Tax=Cytobacillus gottheilii TaxID=859144 RepID=A0ABX8FDB5_9BACI|nr:LysR family transcriptional regulator [Cytobacillus gottheilii]QVY62094.1 LysR family transcriptional regulator [Cytobacillus gottheilii]
MDLKQLEYIIKIAEEKNITRAAEKLFITQSALNQQLLKLEKELGAQLFLRSRANWQLTRAGEIYIENAKSIMRIKKDTYNQINDLLEKQKGKITIGLTHERGYEMFASVYPIFYKKFPHIKIEPYELTVRQQQHEIMAGNLDLGFLTLQDHQKTKDEYIPICKEEIILAVPGSHPLAHLGAAVGDTLPEIDLQHFHADSFAIMQKGSTLRDLFDQLISEDELNILLETKSCHNLFTMVAEGICCSVIPAIYAKDHHNVKYFSIRQKPTWNIYASYKKGSYLSHPAKEFIRYASFYWNKKCNTLWNNL